MAADRIAAPDGEAWPPRYRPPAPTKQVPVDLPAVRRDGPDEIYPDWRGMQADSPTGYNRAAGEQVGAEPFAITACVLAAVGWLPVALLGGISVIAALLAIGCAAVSVRRVSTGRHDRHWRWLALAAAGAAFVRIALYVPQLI